MEKIIASPQYGKNLSKFTKTVLFICLVIFIIYIIAYIAVLICSAINIIQVDLEITVSLTIFCLIGTLGAVVSILRLHKQYKFEKKIKKWEHDFVKIYATISIATNNKSIIQEYTIIAKFMCNGNTYILEKNAGNNLSGFDKVLKELIGRHVPIYFSNQYNEYVFIKDTKLG